MSEELKTQKVCRFCLIQDESILTNLYSQPTEQDSTKSSVPLPLQVMSSVSIEVFPNDGLPAMICDYCRVIMEYCYRFKQMCKQADNLLRQSPFTGSLPEKLQRPIIPQQIYNLNLLNSTIRSEIKPQTQRKKTPVSSQPANAVENKANKGIPMKILNKTPMKILNKNIDVLKEPILKQAVIKHCNDGKVELITEIIDTENLADIDPIKTAEPVETNVFSCTQCERSFPLQQLLDIHMTYHNRERKYPCQYCDKRFFSKYDLGKHTVIHTQERPYKCVACDKAFSRSTLLARHERVHTDIPKFLCAHCERPFISKEHLEKHVEKHNRIKRYQCKICDKSFAFKQGLDRHEILHLKDQPYPCQYCNLSFPTPNKLSRHLTAHAGKRPFPCKHCPKSFLLSHHLTRHLRSHYEGRANFQCYICGQTFTARDKLIYHSAIHCTEELTCPICKEPFNDIDSVTRHVLLHSEGEQFACEFCDLIFMTQGKLSKHTRKEHSDDMAAYEQHDKNKKIPTSPTSRTQQANFDLNQEETSVIQEYVIEELDMEGNVQMVNPIIKEEIGDDDNTVFVENQSAVKLERYPAKRKRTPEYESSLQNENFNASYLISLTEDETALLEELIAESPTTPLPTPKLKQTTLKAFTENLPSCITVIKKENKSPDPPKKISPTIDTSAKSKQVKKHIATVDNDAPQLNLEIQTQTIHAEDNNEDLKTRSASKNVKGKRRLITNETEKNSKRGKLNLSKGETTVLKNSTKKKL